jgi:hypothetical protein
MRTSIVMLVVGLSFAGTPRAYGQGIGSAVAGPGGFSGFFGSSSSALQVAGGAEALFRGVAGVGGEFGVFLSGGDFLTALSVDGVVHVTKPRSRSRFSPFVCVGYSAMGDGDVSFKAVNAGVGLDIWSKDRVGLRLDFRDHLRSDPRGDVHYWTIRAGIAFR